MKAEPGTRTWGQVVYSEGSARKQERERESRGKWNKQRGKASKGFNIKAAVSNRGSALLGPKDMRLGHLSTNSCLSGKRICKNVTVPTPPELIKLHCFWESGTESGKTGSACRSGTEIRDGRGDVGADSQPLYTSTQSYLFSAFCEFLSNIPPNTQNLCYSKSAISPLPTLLQICSFKKCFSDFWWDFG